MRTISSGSTGLIEERLQHSQKMELVGRLASGIAHEINNPLNFIQLNFTTQQEYFADLRELYHLNRKLAEQGGPDVNGQRPLQQELRRLEQEIEADSLISGMKGIFIDSQRGIDRIRKIVEGMRSLSYRRDLDKKAAADINRIVLDSLNMARGEYRFCADLETGLGEVPAVLCVVYQVNQVLLNLIVNGAHAIQSQHRREKGKIAIRTWSDDAKAYCVVADDGPGIPEEIRSHIFNPFFTTKSAGKGTGLGLSISYDIIVNKHNGEISVTCPPEGGTAFTFYSRLPATGMGRYHEKHFGDPGAFRRRRKRYDQRAQALLSQDILPEIIRRIGSRGATGPGKGAGRHPGYRCPYAAVERPGAHRNREGSLPRGPLPADHRLE